MPKTAPNCSAILLSLCARKTAPFARVREDTFFCLAVPFCSCCIFLLLSQHSFPWLLFPFYFVDCCAKPTVPPNMTAIEKEENTPPDCDEATKMASRLFASDLEQSRLLGLVLKQTAYSHRFWRCWWHRAYTRKLQEERSSLRKGTQESLAAYEDLKSKYAKLQGEVSDAYKDLKNKFDAKLEETSALRQEIAQSRATYEDLHEKYSKLQLDLHQQRRGPNILRQHHQRS